MEFSAGGGRVGFLCCHLGIVECLVGFGGQLLKKTSVDRGFLRELCRCLSVRDGVQMSIMLYQCLRLCLGLRLRKGLSMVKSGLRLVQALLLHCCSLSSRRDGGFHLLKVLSSLGCLKNGIGLVGQNAVLSSAKFICSLS